VAAATSRSRAGCASLQAVTEDAVQGSQHDLPLWARVALAEERRQRRDQRVDAGADETGDPADHLVDERRDPWHRADGRMHSLDDVHHAQCRIDDEPGARAQILGVAAERARQGAFALRHQT